MNKPSKNRKSSSFSDIIDIGKLERENRKFLILGYIAGVVIICAIHPLLSKKHISDLAINKREFRIPLRIVTLHSTAEKKSALPDRDKIEPSSLAVDDTLKKETPEERKMASILLKTPPKKSFPSLGEEIRDSLTVREDTAKIDFLHIPYPAPDDEAVPFDFRKYNKIIPLSENTITIIGPGYGIIYYDPFPDKEEEEDERRQFKYDILGIPIGGKGLAFGVGPGSIFLDAGGVVNSGRHFLKSIVWKIEDMVKEGRIQTHCNSTFSRVMEKDIRFMVLLWRYDRVDPRKISHKDRLYISGAKSNASMPHYKYLDNMEKRGLASSLKKKGRLVYKSNFSRDEILHTFFAAYGAIEEKETKDAVLLYINLINNDPDI